MRYLILYIFSLYMSKGPWITKCKAIKIELPSVMQLDQICNCYQFITVVYSKSRNPTNCSCIISQSRSLETAIC